MLALRSVYPPSLGRENISVKSKMLRNNKNPNSAFRVLNRPEAKDKCLNKNDICLSFKMNFRSLTKVGWINLLNVKLVIK